MKALVLAACLAAFALVRPAAAAERLVRVDLAIDLKAGRVSGEAETPDGGMMLIRVERPPLAKADMPFDGYIGPEGALLPLSAGWLPPLPADADGWRVSVATPAGYLAVPYPGGTVERAADGAVARFVLDRVTARAPLVVGPYEMTERQASEVTIRTFFTAANAGQAESYLDAATEAVETLAAKIGPYPYDAFAVVETPLPVGLGYPGYTLVSGRILPLPFMRGRSLWHEISHVWWGNGVLVDYANGNWAEGFAVFFADYALAEREGAAAAREMRYDWLLEYDALPADEVAPLRAFTSKSHGGAQAIGYGKAAMTLHRLRRMLGEEAFDAGVARFWRDNQGKVAGWADVETAFAATSGQDLSAFFDRWIDEPGAAPAD
ncbi:MAG: M1 family aminopeptidase, partial [Alphaproteobacteria bacterium]